MSVLKLVFIEHLRKLPTKYYTVDCDHTWTLFIMTLGKYDLVS